MFEHRHDCSSSDLKADLGKRKLSARFVPHFLTPEQREARVTSCQYIIAVADADKKIKIKNIAGDETWYLPTTPKQNDRVVNNLVRNSLGRSN